MRVSFEEDEGERICVVEPADRAPAAQVVLVHGLTDHLGRQLRFSRWLARRGYRAVSFELRGHGGQASAWDDSLWVYEAYARTESAGDTLRALERAPGWARSRVPRLARDQYERLRTSHVEDHLAQLRRVLERTRLSDPELPVVLAGHSMGALLGLETLRRSDGRTGADLHGVVLLSPALEPQARPNSPVEDRLVGSVWAGRRGAFPWTRALVKAALDLNLPVDTTWGNRWMSDLADEVALFGADPLVPRRLPTRYGSSIESLMAAFDRSGFVLRAPGLVLLPGRDGITSARAGLAFARSMQRRVGPERLTVVHLERVCAHDLLRSSARDSALHAIGDWLDATLGHGGSAPV